ncbi:MAG: hypothetical protein Q6363_007800 [Candidatus Njordarchaeota archaeon]
MNEKILDFITLAIFGFLLSLVIVGIFHINNPLVMFIAMSIDDIIIILFAILAFFGIKRR